MIRVLYAEDDPHVADLIRVYFARFGAGCSLQVVDSGKGCLAAMETGGFDVLLLDLKMPDIDGLEVLGVLASRCDPTPVIMVSGEGQHELAVRAIRAGAVDCIDKTSPDFRRMPDIVQRVYTRHRRQQGTAPACPRDHRVLFVDPAKPDLDAAQRYFASGAYRLRLTAAGTDTLHLFLADELEFDAVVLGPNLETIEMFDALRHLRARDENLPVVVIAQFDHADTTIAAFKLGAHDYLIKGPGCLAELVSSLNHALQRADAGRLNATLTSQLATLNQTLAAQVATRTQELQREVAVRREAEQRAEDNAARLQALSTRLLQVQEEERRSLAQELHDQIGQLLTGLRFQLEAAREAAPSPPLHDALTVTSDLLGSVRALTLQLRPRVLDDLGLKPALEWQTKVFQNQTGIVVDLELSLPEARLSPELEITVFRMVQEALTNVARHSGARAAVVTVTADDSALHVEISDRGCGFDTTAAHARRDSLGLAGLAERVRLARGHLDFVSQIGRGTRLHAEFLLAPPQTP